MRGGSTPRLELLGSLRGVFYLFPREDKSETPDERLEIINPAPNLLQNVEFNKKKAVGASVIPNFIFYQNILRVLVRGLLFKLKPSYVKILKYGI
jgi:hypothetical protein